MALFAGRKKQGGGIVNSREEYSEEQKALYEMKLQGYEREDYGYERQEIKNSKHKR